MAINIVVPQLGESVVEARVARWLKKEGDAVEAGEPVVELETEKIDLEVGAEQAGVLAQIKHQEGDDVKVGDVLAVVEPGAAAASASGRRPASAAPRRGSRAGARRGQPRRTPARTPRTRRSATPTARKMAEAHDVALAGVAGSGDAGRITKQDVAGQIRRLAGRPRRRAAGSAAQLGARPAAPPPLPAAKAAKPAAPPCRRPRRAPPGTRAEERVRMSKRRLTIARSLVEAQRTAAMLTTFNEVDMTALMALRERRKEAFKKRTASASASRRSSSRPAVGALRAFPRLNAEIQGEEIVLKQYYDIGIAVGAPQGLVVPVHPRRRATCRSPASSRPSATSPARRRTAR